MEWTSLVMGLALAIGVFAVKTGIGQFFYLQRLEKLRFRVGLILLTLVAYALVFTLAYWLLSTIDVLAHFSSFQRLFELGAVIHVGVATGLFIWGIVLVVSSGDSEEVGRKGADLRRLGPALLLIVPCPVCASAILVSTGCLIGLFPANASLSVVLAYLLFAIVSVLTVLTLGVIRQRANVSSGALVGSMMMFIALYFCLTILVVPQFNDVERVYRIAMYSAEENAAIPHALAFLVVIVCLFVTGFANRLITIRRISK